jgi:ferredoxin
MLRPGRITLHFRDAKGGLLKTVEANEGDDILSIAHEHDIDLEGESSVLPPLPAVTHPRLGACEGSIACSTCHVILPAEFYDLIDEPGDDENDMLDMAFGLTDTSRLGCQVHLTKEMDGMSVQLPAATRNMFVDGTPPMSLPTAPSNWLRLPRTQANASLDDLPRAGTIT